MCFVRARSCFASRPGKAATLATLVDSNRNAKPDERIERQLLRAEAVGESQEREGGAKASIESTRFTATTVGNSSEANGEPPDPVRAERAIERLMYVEGDRLIADQVDGTITAPGEGKLLLDDRRAKASEAPEGAEPAPAVVLPLPADLSSARGTTLFKWMKELKYTRADGTVRLTGGIRALHREAPGRCGAGHRRRFRDREAQRRECRGRAHAWQAG